MAVRHYAADPHEQSLDSCLCGRRGRTADRAGPQSPFVSGGQVTARLTSYSSSGWRDWAGENDVALNRHGCSASAAYTNPRCNHMHPNVPSIFEISNKESSSFRGFFMELAGLEPATSWVRFKSAALANLLHKRVSGQSIGAEPRGYPALTRGFWGWDPLHPQNDWAWARARSPSVSGATYSVRLETRRSGVGVPTGSGRRSATRTVSKTSRPSSE